jgi:hypothetical protein
MRTLAIPKANIGFKLKEDETNKHKDCRMIATQSKK